MDILRVLRLTATIVYNLVFANVLVCLLIPYIPVSVYTNGLFWVDWFKFNIFQKICIYSYLFIFTFFLFQPTPMVGQSGNFI